MTEYSKAPQVTRDRLYLDAMQQILTNSSKILVDQKSGSNLLYLPLDKLMQIERGQCGAPGCRPKPAEAVLPARTPAEVSPRSRDAFRSRDREAR